MSAEVRAFGGGGHRGGDRREGTGPSDPDWPARQRGLGIDTHGETLYPREIEFVERFQRLGHRIEWIERDRRDASGLLLPTNDFVWLSHDRTPTELKSTVPKYRSIRDHLRRTVVKADRRGITKDTFVIDLGRQRLSPKLSEQLALYNQRVEAGQIRELWVLSLDGARLDHIRLRT